MQQFDPVNMKTTESKEEEKNFGPYQIQNKELKYLNEIMRIYKIESFVLLFKDYNG